MQIIEIKGTRLAIGMWWLSPGPPEGKAGAGGSKRRKKMRSTALALASEFGEKDLDVWVPMDAEGQMIGLGRSEIGLGKGKVYSLAAAMATSGVRNCIGMFALAGGFWVCAVHNGVIFPDGDFFGDQRDAEGMLDHIKSFDLKFDEEWLFEDEDDSLEFLSRYVESATGLPCLQPLKAKGPSKVLVFAVVAGLLFAGYQIWASKQEAELARQQAALMEQERQQAAEKAKPLPPVTSAQIDAAFGRPWENTPKPSEVVTACSILLDTPTHLKGWALKSAECDGSSVHLLWQFSQQTSTFTKLPYPELTVLDDASPTLAHTRVNIPVPSPVRGIQVLRETAQARQQFYEISRRVRASGVAFAWSERATATIGEGTAVQTVKCPYVRATWQHGESLTYPSEAGAYLDLIPGLTLSKISFNGENWKTEGSVYANAK